MRVAGLTPRTLALGASFTAVIIGLAAQQTVGNVIAGVGLLSAWPFQPGHRVRFTGFGMEVEGTVTAHGLLYLTLADGDDLVMAPEQHRAVDVELAAARAGGGGHARPLAARRGPRGDPAPRGRACDGATKRPPHVQLEEFDGDEVVVRIRAVPADHRNGAKLSREVLETVAAIRDELSESANSGGKPLLARISWRLAAVVVLAAGYTGVRSGASMGTPRTTGSVDSPHRPERTRS